MYKYNMKTESRNFKYWVTQTMDTEVFACLSKSSSDFFFSVIFDYIIYMFAHQLWSM
jgi:hypothetical protein